MRVRFIIKSPGADEARAGRQKAGAHPGTATKTGLRFRVRPSSGATRFGTIRTVGRRRRGGSESRLQAVGHAIGQRAGKILTGNVIQTTCRLKPGLHTSRCAYLVGNLRPRIGISWKASPSFVKSTSEDRQPWALMRNPFGIEGRIRFMPGPIVFLGAIRHPNRQARGPG